MTVREAPPRGADAIAAEAALWIVRTADTRATGRRDPGFEQWLAEHPGHRTAFAKATGVWRGLGTAASPRPHARARATRAWSMPPPPLSRRYSWAAALAACLILIVVGGQFLSTAYPVYATVVGEQRSIRLADQTRVMLNTDTRIAVRYDAAQRRVVLERGEALFDVAHNPARPFYVESGGDYIRAVGTSFTVRRDAQGLEVTLLSGKVLIGRIGAAAARVALEPGERLRLTGARAPVIDRPVVDDVTAWRRGQIVFDATPVAAAIAEMNRYSAMPVMLRASTPPGARLSGVFETGESESFAGTLAAIYGLRAVKTGAGYQLQASVAAPAR